MYLSHKRTAYTSLAFESILRFGDLSIMQLAVRLYEENHVSLHIHGSSVDLLITPVFPIKFSDLDLMGIDYSPHCMATKSTIESFFKRPMTPLAFSRHIFGYQIKDVTLGNTPTQFSITLYTTIPPTSPFDDLAHSLTIALTPQPHIGHKYIDDGLSLYMKKNRLLFTPTSFKVTKHFFRTAMREVTGWNGTWNHEFDRRVFSQFSSSVYDAQTFQQQFLQMFSDHFLSTDTNSFLKMAFFCLARISRFSTNTTTAMPVINKLLKDNCAMTFDGVAYFVMYLEAEGILKNATTYLTLPYSFGNYASILPLKDAFAHATQFEGKQAIFSDLSQQLAFHIGVTPPVTPGHIPEFLPLYILDSWALAPNPPQKFFEEVICPLLHDLAPEQRGSYLINWIKTNKILLTTSEIFLNTTPTFKAFYISYLQGILQNQKKPSPHLQKKLEALLGMQNPLTKPDLIQPAQVSIEQATPALPTRPDSPLAPVSEPHEESTTPVLPEPTPVLPDPTVGLGTSLATRLKDTKKFLVSEFLSFMDYAALESEGWGMHNAYVDVCLYEQGRRYLAAPRSFVDDLNETHKAYSNRPDAFLKMAFFAFARLHRYSTHREASPLLQAFLTLMLTTTQNNFQDIKEFSAYLKAKGHIEKPGPYLNVQPLILPADITQLAECMEIYKDSLDDCNIQKLRQTLDGALMQFLRQKEQNAEKTIQTITTYRSTVGCVSPVMNSQILDALLHIEEHESPQPASLLKTLRDVIINSHTHENLNARINTLFKRYCSERTPLTKPLVDYAIRTETPVTTIYVLQGLSLLSDNKPKTIFCLYFQMNPGFCLLP